MTLGDPILTAAEMAAAERSSGVPLATLMDRAGYAVAAQTRRFASGRSVLVVCGPGNNGGDGYVAAKRLREWGLDVAVAQGAAPTSDLACRAAALWDGPVQPLDAAAPRPVLVDALFGVGLARPLAAPLARALRERVEHADFSLAVDLPSGLYADDGTGAAAAVTATLALGALKPAHVLLPGLERCGTLLLDSLGLELRSRASRLGRPRLHAPAVDAHKYSRGLVAVIGGAMSGAARLLARAALSAGAGYVRLLVPDAGPCWPDALVVQVGAPDLTDERIAAAVVGPGLGRDAAARERLDAALASDRPLVIDGDALTLLGSTAARRVRSRAAATILTPHAGEFARMTDGDDRDALTAARAFARESGAVVVRKGPATVVAAPDGRAGVGAGPSWLSTAGTGDVLAGTVAARLAVEEDGFEAATQAVWLHARAAAIAGPAFHADDLVPHLPAAIAECL